MLQRVCQTQGGPETWMFRRLQTDVKQGIITIIIISIQDNVYYIILLLDYYPAAWKISTFNSILAFSNNSDSNFLI